VLAAAWHRVVGCGTRAAHLGEAIGALGGGRRLRRLGADAVGLRGGQPCGAAAAAPAPKAGPAIRTCSEPAPDGFRVAILHAHQLQEQPPALPSLQTRGKELQAVVKGIEQGQTASRAAVQGHLLAGVPRVWRTAAAAAAAHGLLSSPRRCRGLPGLDQHQSERSMLIISAADSQKSNDMELGAEAEGQAWCAIVSMVGTIAVVADAVRAHSCPSRPCTRVGVTRRCPVLQRAHGARSEGVCALMHCNVDMLHRLRGGAWCEVAGAGIQQTSTGQARGSWLTALLPGGPVSAVAVSRGTKRVELVPPSAKARLSKACRMRELAPSDADH
jgi:hypothetical protein